jgi:hypothetical protein
LEGGLFFWGGNLEEEGKEEILEKGRRRRLEDKDCFGGNFYRGTVVAGNFGLGGQETARIPGAREPERLFLVGWEVNIQFWAVWARTRTKEQGDKSTKPAGRGMYFTS